MATIYTAEGLRAISRLLDEQIEDLCLYSQNALGLKARVAPSTIGEIRANRNLTPEDFEETERQKIEKGKKWASKRYYEPDLKTILDLAKVVIDPLTNQPFGNEGQPCRFEKIIRGWDLPYAQGKSGRNAVITPNPLAVALIRDAIAKKPERFEKAGLPINGDQLKRLLKGEEPTLSDLMRLQDVLGSEPMNTLMSLYGIDTKVKVNSSDRSKNGVK